MWRRSLLLSRRIERLQQDLGDLVGKALAVSFDQNPPRIGGIGRRCRHAMLEQGAGAADPVAVRDRQVV